MLFLFLFFFFSSRRRHTRFDCDWSSDVCSSDLAAWGAVQRALAGTTRVCSYDRAGLGWSEAGDRPYDPGRVPEELRTLLGRSEEHTSELQSQSNIVCRLLLEKKKNK